jgi:uncharacterized protein YecE (DUF72 family)
LDSFYYGFVILFMVTVLSIQIGTSGWSYNDWIGPFYLKKSGKFSYYTGIFNTTEINSTFYKYPSSGMIWGLLRNSPPGFIFASKLPKLITHDKWLRKDKDVINDTRRFLELLRPLAERLGPILIQLRPKFTFDEHYESLEAYLEAIPKNYDWAVEFRHNSWLREESFELLSKNNVAYTIVDEPLLPPDTYITADFAYIRWHGHGTKLWYDYEYSEDQLDEWVPKIKEVTKQARRTYGYFNNHFRGNAVKNAIEMLDKMDQVSSVQKSILKKIIEFRAVDKYPNGVQSLDLYTLDEDDIGVADHLKKFTDLGRIARGEKIKNEELEVTSLGFKKIEAKIRNYYISIDMEHNFLKHDCDDWRKGLSQKRFCKHLVKLFLSIPPGVAAKILINIWNNKDLWVFE